MEVTAERVDQEIQEWWIACMDGKDSMAPACAVINSFKAVGLLTDEKRELWRLRIVNQCPEAADGHSGGRSWCAYCGDIPREAGG